MDTELEDLHGALSKRGLSAHWHPAGDQGECAAGEVCIRDGDGFTGVVTSPDKSRTVFVDPMTAWGVIEGLGDSAGPDEVWAELDSIDHGQ